MTEHLVPEENDTMCGEIELTCEKLFSNKAEFDKSQTKQMEGLFYNLVKGKDKVGSQKLIGFQ